MIPGRDLASWEEFEHEITKIFAWYEKTRGQARTTVSSLLFRGQENSTWELSATLDRYPDRPWWYGVSEYHGIIRPLKSTILSLSGACWGDQDLPEPLPKDYGFMIHLRQHGFPSPLLDWSRSPYVAAFFAFREKPVSEDQKIAIFVFVEYAGHAKVWDAERPTIWGLGPFVHTHRRHFIQQCEYTICLNGKSDDPSYGSHEQALKDQPPNTQNLCSKYTIPASERKKVLDRLYTMNINAHSLFGTDDTLMETLAYEAFLRRGWAW